MQKKTVIGDVLISTVENEQFGYYETCVFRCDERGKIIGWPRTAPCENEIVSTDFASALMEHDRLTDKAKNGDYSY